MYQRILNDQVTYPDYISEYAVDLLSRLLRKNPKERPTISEIKKHRFLLEIKWEELVTRKIAPPYDLDYTVSHFDPEYTSHKVSWSEGDDMHEADYRSQSVCEFIKEQETDSICEQEISVMISSNAEKLKSEYSTNSKAYKTPMLTKRKLPNNAIKELNEKIISPNWRANLELFLGYSYSNDSKPKSDDKITNRMSTPQSSTTSCSYNKKEDKNKYIPASTTKISVGLPKNNHQAMCTLLNKSPIKNSVSPTKACSLQAVTVLGESNDQDIDISDSDIEEYSEENCVEKIMYRKCARKYSGNTNKIQSRCASTENLRKPVSKYNPKPGIKNDNKYKHQAKAPLDPYEIYKLLKSNEQTKITAGIIKLHDDMNCVISERNRKDSPDKNAKPLIYPHKQKVSSNQLNNIGKPTARAVKKKMPSMATHIPNIRMDKNNSRLFKNDNLILDPEMIFGRRVITNVSKSPKKPEYTNESPKNLSKHLEFSKKSFSSSSKKIIPSRPTTMRSSQKLPKASTKNLSATSKIKPTLKNLGVQSSKKFLQIPIDVESIISQKHTPKAMNSDIHINIKGNVKIDNHIIIVPESRYQEFHTAINSPVARKQNYVKMQKKPKGEDELTDLTINEDTEEHEVSPPRNPKFKIAYFSQHK